MRNLMAMPTVTLTNGIRVANFSSPHEFTFEDGSVLGRCDDERATALSGNKVSTLKPSACGRWENEAMSFVSTPVLMGEIMEACKEDVDVILVPLITLRILCAEWGEEEARVSPFRTIVSVSRTDKRVQIARFGTV